MRKIIIFFLVLFINQLAWADVSVLKGVTTPKKKEIAIYPTPSKMEIDDEMLPTSNSLYLFEVCAIGKEELIISAQQQPAQRGAKAANTPYKTSRYQPVRKCKNYVGANTPLDKRNMINAAAREIYVPNRHTIDINIKAYLGNPHATFIVKDKAMMPYTIAYNEMPKGSVLKKILVAEEKIAKFYSFNLPASIYLNSIVQKRFYRELPIRISFYEEMIENGQARTFIVFVFNEAEKYTYQPAANEIASDKVYDITPDFAVQYLQ